MKIWITYSLRTILTGGAALVAYFFIRNKSVKKQAEFDPASEWFI